jgi:apolipoprotein N-acyltransferase
VVGTADPAPEPDAAEPISGPRPTTSREAHGQPAPKSQRWGLALAAGGGVVSALSLPPVDLYPTMFFGLAMLAWALHDAPRARRGALLGLLWGTAGQLVGMRFIPSVIQLFTDLGLATALLSHVLLSAAQSLHWAIGMAVATTLHRRLKAPLELAFGAGVLVALVIPSVFVWSPAGLLSPWPILVQLADVIGERGVSVLIAIVAALLARAARSLRDGRRFDRGAQLALGGAVAIVGAMVGYGAIAMHRYGDGEDRARIALIHAGIDPRYRWDPKNAPKILAELKQQTALAERGGVDLSVWPEAAYPFMLPHDAKKVPRGTRNLIGGAIRGPILFGYIAVDRPHLLPSGEEEQFRYNSATVLEPDGDLQPSYDKMELLWFGEMVPLGQHWTWLRRLFHRSGSLMPGAELRALRSERRDHPELVMGVLNCYEDTLPGHGRRLATLAPNLLVNVTNDAWFVGTVEPELHLRLSALRSIELRRDMVRAVNLGVPAWIDAAGRVRARYDKSEPGSLRVEPTVRSDGPTLYARFGDYPAFLLLAGAIGFTFHRRRDSGVRVVSRATAE